MATDDTENGPQLDLLARGLGPAPGHRRPTPTTWNTAAGIARWTAAGKTVGLCRHQGRGRHLHRWHPRSALRFDGGAAPQLAPPSA